MELNHRPLPCQGSALPLSHAPDGRNHESYQRDTGVSIIPRRFGPDGRGGNLSRSVGSALSRSVPVPSPFRPRSVPVPSPFRPRSVPARPRGKPATCHPERGLPPARERSTGPCHPERGLPPAREGSAGPCHPARGFPAGARGLRRFPVIPSAVSRPARAGSAGPPSFPAGPSPLRATPSPRQGLARSIFPERCPQRGESIAAHAPAGRRPRGRVAGSSHELPVLVDDVRDSLMGCGGAEREGGAVPRYSATRRLTASMRPRSVINRASLSSAFPHSPLDRFSEPVRSGSLAPGEGRAWGPTLHQGPRNRSGGFEIDRRR
jgi:hypothetical protein